MRFDPQAIQLAYLIDKFTYTITKDHGGWAAWRRRIGVPLGQPSLFSVIEEGDGTWVTITNPIVRDICEWLEIDDIRNGMNISRCSQETAWQLHALKLIYEDEDYWPV